MPLSRKQQIYLHEMGITLWSKRNTSVTNVSTTTSLSNITENHEHSLTVSLDELGNSVLFSDILHSIGYSLNECKISDNVLSLDLLSWIFTQKPLIQLDENQLITPPLHVIAESADLKKQLWQHLSSVSVQAQ